MRKFLLVSTCAALAACTSTSPPDTEPPPRYHGECQADPASYLVGAKASAEIGNQLLQLTGATTLRWVPPRTAVTMDFRADRLTVSYDDDMIITRISCT